MDIAVGDYLVFDVSFEYLGPHYTFAEIRTSIGKNRFGVFDEHLYGTFGLTVPETLSWTLYTQRVSVKITSVLVQGDTYDLEVKLQNAPGGVNIWRLASAIRILGAAITGFRNLTATISRRLA